MTCDNCDKYKLRLILKSYSPDKWELRDHCCGTERYGRSLRHIKKVPSYISYQNECEIEGSKKILNKRSYIAMILNSNPFKDLNPPTWCPKKDGDNHEDAI